MDPGSGVFTAPVGGVYLVALHVCTHDMKKALISVRRNGKEELATVYDQVIILLTKFNESFQKPITSKLKYPKMRVLTIYLAN